MRFPAALLALLALLPPLEGLLAQAPPRLDSASLTWLQRGSEQRITLKGDGPSAREARDDLMRMMAPR